MKAIEQMIAVLVVAVLIGCLVGSGFIAGFYYCSYRNVVSLTRKDVEIEKLNRKIYFLEYEKSGEA